MEDIEIIELPFKMGKIEQILMVGTGTSTCVPSLGCLAASPATCKVCLDAASMYPRSPAYNQEHGGPPPGKASRNLRTNPSAVIRYRHSDGTLHSVLLDCGKTFYSNALKHMLRAGVRELDGVLLTHGHADAVLGLDDLRHWAGQTNSIQSHVDIFSDDDTFNYICTAFPYLVDVKKATGGGEVSTLKFYQFQPAVCPNGVGAPTEAMAPVRVGELMIQPVRLYHGFYSDGRPFYANGFVVEGFAYFSDTSGIPSITQTYLDSHRDEIKILAIDCLLEDGFYKSHWSWPESKELVSQLNPLATVLVGMAHTVDYYSFQRRLDQKRATKHPMEDVKGTGIVDKFYYVPNRVFVGFDGMLFKFK